MWLGRFGKEGRQRYVSILILGGDGDDEIGPASRARCEAAVELVQKIKAEQRPEDTLWITGYLLAGWGGTWSPKVANLRGRRPTLAKATSEHLRGLLRESGLEQVCPLEVFEGGGGFQPRNVWGTIQEIELFFHQEPYPERFVVTNRWHGRRAILAARWIFGKHIKLYEAKDGMRPSLIHEALAYGKFFLAKFWRRRLIWT